MKQVCQVPECHQVFEGSECPKCFTISTYLKELTTFAIPPKIKKPRGTRSATTWKAASQIPYTLVPISNLLRIQLYTQALLVRKIITCNGDFKKQSSPEIQEIRKDLYHMYVEIRSRRQRVS